jgi:hypothetical protein
MEYALNQLLGFVAKFLIHGCLSNQSRQRGGMPREIVNPPLYPGHEGLRPLVSQVF